MKQANSIWKYSEQYVSRLMEVNNKEKFDGNDIKQFSSLKYLNLLLVKNLMLEWKNELKKLESPYFDFSNQEVQDSLSRFANTLSRHIRMDRETTRRLAIQSTYECIVLFSSPYDYFNDLIRDERIKNLSVEEFKKLTSYFKINEHVMESFVSLLIERGIKKIHGNIDLLDELFGRLSAPPADPAPFIEAFSEILPLTEHILYGENTTKPVESSKKETKADEIISESKRIDPSTSKPHESISRTGKSIVEIHQKITDIKKSLSLNQRFMFVNHLFNGSETYFEETISRIEMMDTYENAIQFISTEFSWNHEEEEVQEFLEIVERRLIK